VYCIVTASNEPVISCDNIQINHSFLILLAISRLKFSTRKLKEYYPRQSADSKNSAICICKWTYLQTAHHCIGHVHSLTAAW